MDFEEITKDWNESGLLVIPRFLDPLEIAELRRICDHVLQRAIAESSGSCKCVEHRVFDRAQVFPFTRKSSPRLPRIYRG